MASFGVSTFDEDATSPESLLKSADVCLYKAKEQGRNRVVKADGRSESESETPAA